jgi:hypothetical protein
MIAVPGGKFVLASDVVGVDAEREIAELHRRLALAVAEVKFWRDDVGIYKESDQHVRRPPPPYCRDCAADEGQPHNTGCKIAATNADPELAKMIGGEG